MVSLRCRRAAETRRRAAVTMSPIQQIGHVNRIRTNLIHTTMSISQLSRKVPPGLILIGSLLSNWKLVSLPLILSGVFKPNFWQTILIFPATLSISIAIAVYLRNRRYAKRQKELGAVLPPPIPSKSFGGLDVLRSLRWEYHFGYIGDSYFG